MTRTWPDLPGDHLYGEHNLPYGVFSIAADGGRGVDGGGRGVDGGGRGVDGGRRVGVRLGDHVLDLAALGGDHPEAADWVAVWSRPTLNPFLALGPAAWGGAREWLGRLLADPAHRDAVRARLVRLDRVDLHLPVAVGDYVDFYASEHHATNVGSIFRPDGAPLTPNWKHLPIGYHGRSGTIVVSGTEVVRPVGQRLPRPGEPPVVGASTKLDIEAEVAFVVAGATRLGTRVTVDEADRHLFGVALFNDWSARDIQAWEYVPLGPFLGKSISSSLGAWVVPLAALAAARVPLPDQEPEPAAYLRGSVGGGRGLDLRLEVRLNGQVVSRPPYASMYWSPEQMLAHLTVNGAGVRDGDLFASGTVSGPDPATRGSLLELAWNGTQPIILADGSTRAFLEDGDTVTIAGWAPGPHGARVGLGEVTGTIGAALPL